MRFWIGKRLPLGLRAGVSFGAEDFRARSRAFASAPQSSVRSSDFVYVIRAQDHDMIKVGKSADPFQRLGNLQTGSPWRLEFAYVAAAKSGDASQIENVAKNFLAPHRREGEWFAVPVEMAVAAISAASYQTNNPIVAVPSSQISEVVRLAALEAQPPQAAGPARHPLWYWPAIGTLMLIAFPVVAGSIWLGSTIVLTGMGLEPISVVNAGIVAALLIAFTSRSVLRW